MTSYIPKGSGKFHGAGGAAGCNSFRTPSQSLNRGAVLRRPVSRVPRVGHQLLRAMPTSILSAHGDPFIA